MYNNIVISVLILSYNHERYIAQALESVLCQRLNGQYEIIIGDDASTDHTQDIIRQYAKKFPDIIKPVLREENVGAMANFVDLLTRCHAPYIAFLEGDDYWNHPRKLQMQYDFLEKRPEYVATSSLCNYVDKNNNILWQYNNTHYASYSKKNYTAKDYKKDSIPGLANSMLLRNIFLTMTYDWKKLYTIDPILGDQINFFLLTLNGGKIYCSHKKLLNYRYIVTTVDNNYSSQYAHSGDVQMHMFQYCNDLENKYYELTNCREHLRRRKAQHFDVVFIRFIKSFSSLEFNNLVQMLRAEPHPFLLLIEFIKVRIRVLLK